jgi:hypothetical protein
MPLPSAQVAIVPEGDRDPDKQTTATAKKAPPLSKWRLGWELATEESGKQGTKL